MLNGANFRAMVPGYAQDISLDEAARRLDSYPSLAVDEQRLVSLATIASLCRRYLDAAASGGRQVGPEGMVLLGLERDAQGLMKSIKARGRWKKIKESPALKNGVQGLQQKQLANTTARLGAVGQHQKVGGTDTSAKPIKNHYWREVFDPKHRAVYATEQYFQQWLKWVTPPTSTAPNADYRADYRESFYEYLDKVGDSAATHVTYFDEEVVRQAHEVVIKAGVLYRPATKIAAARPYSTKGMAINDGVFMNLMLAKNEIKGKFDATGRAMWVMSPEKRLFSGPSFEMTPQGFKAYHHSSFLSGGPILCGGAWEVDKGTLKVISCASGHYRPPLASFMAVLGMLQESGIDLGEVAVQWPVNGPDDHTYFNGKQFASPGITAKFPGWPKRIGQRLALPRVLMRYPRACVDPTEGVDPAKAGAYDPLAAPRGGARPAAAPPLNRAPSAEDHLYDVYANNPNAQGGQGGNYAVYANNPNAEGAQGGGNYAKYATYANNPNAQKAQPSGDAGLYSLYSA